MFLNVEELKSAIYKYQRDQIAEEDDAILTMNILAAQQEVVSRLAGRYDVSAITGWDGVAPRNQLLVEHTKSIAVWYLLRLSNPDILWEKAKVYYEHAMTWLDMAADGKLNPSLPPRDQDGDGLPDGGVSWGGYPKNNNDY